MTPNEAALVWCPDVRLFDQIRPHIANNRGLRGRDRGTVEAEPIDETCRCVHRQCMAWAWVDGAATGDDDEGWCRVYGENPSPPEPEPAPDRIAATAYLVGEDTGHTPGGAGVPYAGMTPVDLAGFTHAGGVFTVATGIPEARYTVDVTALLSVGQLSSSDRLDATVLVNGVPASNAAATWTTGSGQHSAGSGSPGVIAGLVLDVQDGDTFAVSFAGDTLDLRTVTLQIVGFLAA